MLYNLSTQQKKILPGGAGVYLQISKAHKRRGTEPNAIKRHIKKTGFTVHGSGVWSQLCFASHQMITPPTTIRMTKMTMTKPQMRERLLF
jgi:hypothetical protein